MYICYYIVYLAHAAEINVDQFNIIVIKSTEFIITLHYCDLLDVRSQTELFQYFQDLKHTQV